jgi:hypothetical protein
VGAAGYRARKGLDINEVLSLAKTIGKGTCLDLQLVVQNLVLILTLAIQEKKGVLKEDGIMVFSPLVKLLQELEEILMWTESHEIIQ